MDIDSDKILKNLNYHKIISINKYIVHQKDIRLFLALKHVLTINFPNIIILMRHFVLDFNVLDCEYM